MPYAKEFMFYADLSEPATIIRSYVERLKQQATVSSVIDDKDDFDKPVIIDELLMAAEDIEAGNIRVAASGLSQAWMETSNEILLLNRDRSDNQTYKRGITVAQHIHHALFHGGDPAMFTPLR